MSDSKGMLFLDVTSASKSALNTGIKRMQRGLHTWLSNRDDYRPVYWQSMRRSYRELVDRDLIILEQRNDRPLKGLELYDAYGTLSPLDLVHYRRDGGLELGFPGSLKKEDVLFVPDLLWDNRGPFFQRARQNPAKTVAVFHDAIPLRRTSKSAIDTHLCSKGIRILSTFDLVICVSAEAEEDLRHYWKKFGVRPTATHVALWPVPFAGERPRHQPAFHAQSLLFVARLQAYKNHLRLIEACEQLWSEGLKFRLKLIACNSYPIYVWKVKRRVAELQSKGRDISLHSQVTEKELHESYSEASFTAFPSLLEGFGLPILESLWHGRPVVCGDRGAIGEVAKGGGCEPIDPLDPGSIAAAVRRLLTDESHYHKLYQEILQRDFLSWDGYWENVSGAIEALPNKNI